LPPRRRRRRVHCIWICCVAAGGRPRRRLGFSHPVAQKRKTSSPATCSSAAPPHALYPPRSHYSFLSCLILPHRHGPGQRRERERETLLMIRSPASGGRPVEGPRSGRVSGRARCTHRAHRARMAAVCGCGSGFPRQVEWSLVAMGVRRAGRPGGPRPEQRGGERHAVGPRVLFGVSTSRAAPAHLSTPAFQIWKIINHVYQQPTLLLQCFSFLLHNSEQW
jgi:hypothetical protein